MCCRRQRASCRGCALEISEKRIYASSSLGHSCPWYSLDDHQSWKCLLGDCRNEVHSGPLPNIREEDAIRYKQLRSGELGGTPLHRAQWSYLMTSMTFQFLPWKLQDAFSAKRFKDRTHFPPFFSHNITVIRFSWVYSDKQLIKRNMTEEKSIATREEVIYSTSQVCNKVNCSVLKPGTPIIRQLNWDRRRYDHCG